ncbi:recombinase family protein [Clostridium magnum]|uniref:DNA-invertase hin n=1 Tax=Clostridium magnum DSM 2767 TaxID=1121326 RepID=A0A162RC89_9CLOT|nr:recombinase family protein [Clostridium magnum]KZL89700.1 DNA-invertase hin [Clostridium magnum DSM 2767]SHJ62967.1 site-specific DNA recombinase [Clostridium magnum DSM 2767]
MRIAIYSRKSRFVEGSESIENQIEMCKEYIKRNFKNVEDILVYEDEGFSGKNTDRPKFLQMLEDAENSLFNVLICYRLDRISRNIGDFAKIIDELQNLNIDFISIKEQFDTSSPMGRAMMYISSVFAQLERETIAERIKDNMMELAKTGKWLGGKEPLGYVKTGIGKDACLKLDKNYNVVVTIFKKYIELNSLRKLQRYTIKEKILSKKGDFFNINSLKKILSNPCYVIANEDFYNYAKNKRMIICNAIEEFKNNKDHLGIMSYNKYDQTKKLRETTEWIITIGKHKGIIDFDTWIYVQNLIQENSLKAPNSGKAMDALLSGIIKCGDCGSSLRVVASYYKGKRSHHYYKCSAKATSGCLLCDIKNANGYEADKIIMDYIKKLNRDNELVDELFEKNKKELDIDDSMEGLKSLEKLASKYENDIEKLTEKLIEAEGSVASKYIVTKIEKLDFELKEINKKITDLKSKQKQNSINKINIKMFKDHLNYAANNIDKLELEEQKKLVKNIFKEVIWDGENINATPRI